jgi:hypothetical protein
LVNRCGDLAVSAAEMHAAGLRSAALQLTPDADRETAADARLAAPKTFWPKDSFLRGSGKLQWLDIGGYGPVKKLTTIAFALAVIAMTFVACGGSEPEAASPAAEEAAAPAAAPEAAPAEGAAAEGQAPAEAPAEAPAGEAAPKAQ